MGSKGDGGSVWARRVTTFGASSVVHVVANFVESVTECASFMKPADYDNVCVVWACCLDQSLNDGVDIDVPHLWWFGVWGS